MDDPSYTSEYRLGTVALHHGDLCEAVSAFQKVPETSPCWTMAQGNLGLALLTMGRSVDAEHQLRFAIEQLGGRGCLYPPARVQFARNLGEAIGQQGRWAEAVGEFSAACRLADALAEAHKDLRVKFVGEKAHALNSCGSALLQLGRFADAVEILVEARELLAEVPPQQLTGRAEILTNLATALGAIGDLTRARFALLESLDVLEQTGDQDQLFRALVRAGELGLDIVQDDQLVELAAAGASAAREQDRPRVAYLRYTLAASAAARGSAAADVGLAMVHAGRSLERTIDRLDPCGPRLRLFEAQLLRRAGRPAEEYTRVLLEGASQWYQRLAVPLIPADFRTIASDLHLHFRTLAGCFLESERVDDALVAFEAGRALGYAVEVDPAFFSKMIGQNPFAEDGSGIQVNQLRAAQQGLGSDEVGVVIGVIPPHLVAFVISPTEVSTVGARIRDLEQLDQQIRPIPHRLAEGVGARAIPDVLLDLSRDIAERVGRRKVSTLVPYDSLHLAPWRAILRESGLAWNQLAFPTGFNSLLRAAGNSRPGGTIHAVAFGHGTAGTIDLRSEAEEFAGAFAERGRFLDGCSAQQIRDALKSNSIVLLSCHGRAIKRGPVRTELMLELADGASLASDVIPERVSSPLVILSACDSGVYTMAWGDYPLGAGPTLLARGAKTVIGARFPVSAAFAQGFFPSLARQIAAGTEVAAAFAHALEIAARGGADLWRDIACLELLQAI